jgi:dihydrofolate reductase
MTRKITVNMYMTLDGFGVFPKYPGSDVEEDEPDDFWKEMWISRYDSVDTIVFGRRSYEGHAQVHALANRKKTDQEFLYDYSRFLERCKLIVLSNTLQKTTWGNCRIEKGDIGNLVDRLKKEPGKDIIVEGGPSLAHDFIQRRLADDYKMLVMPVIYGKGPHYWGTMVDQETLRLINVKTMAHGELILHYASVR